MAPPRPKDRHHPTPKSNVNDNRAKVSKRQGESRSANNSPPQKQLKNETQQDSNLGSLRLSGCLKFKQPEECVYMYCR